MTQRAERKLLQLEVATSCGLAIPRTIVSNDPHELKEFASRSGRIICKPISQGLVRLDTRWHAVHTREIEAEDLSVLDKSRLPTLLQQLIPKGVDIRLTIIGDDYFAVAIESPEGSGIDWRAIPDQVTYSSCEIPKSIIDSCYQLMRQFDLLYGAFDFVRSNDADYYFLEINPAGEWAWLETALGLPMRDALIRSLGIQ
jgi:glutathione synthase/RimK-type ligase-like ATP-grasp enzyme